LDSKQQRSYHKQPLSAYIEDINHNNVGAIADERFAASPRCEIQNNPQVLLSSVLASSDDGMNHQIG
jgi:hypothetical protein